jgi:hypothetical protein
MTDALLPRQRVAILEYRLMKFETEQCLTLGTSRTAPQMKR